MKSINLQIRLLFSLTILLCPFFTSAGVALNINYSGMNNDDVTITVPVGTLSGTSAATIMVNFDAGTSGNVFWNFGTFTGCSSSGTTTRTCSNITITLPSDAAGVSPLSPVQISVTTTLPMTESEFSFRLNVQTVTDAGLPAPPVAPTRKFIVKIVKPRDVVLVLDNSGSMGSPAGSAPTPTRWQALTNATSLFMDKYEAFHIPGDRISIVYFTTAADGTPFGGGANGSFINITDNTGMPSSSKSQVLASIATKGPDDMTGMGPGLLQAKLKPFSAANKKIVLLFTDGIQNIDPLVNSVPLSGGDASTIGTQAGTGATAVPINSAGGKMIAIGLGEFGDYPALLQKIAENNKGASDPTGYYNTTTGTGTETTGDIGLFNFFTNTVSQILNNSSPQLVSIRVGTAKAEQPIIEKFTVNKSIDKLFFEVVGLGQARITSVKQNGIEKITSGRITNGSNYITFSISVPANATSEGTWEITTIPFKPANYFVAATVDDHLVKYTCGSGNNNYKIDDQFNPTVQLSYLGEAIKENATVQAIILKPGQDIGDLLARAGFTPDSSSGAADVSLSEQKYQALLKDSAFVRKLKATNQFIDLTYRSSDSTYTGNYTFKENAGIYQVIYTIEANHPVTGKILRYEQQSVYVRFADINLGNSTTSFTSRPFVLHIRPITKYGKFIGPGFQNSFSFNSAGAGISQVKDNLDGSYTISFTGDPNATGVLSVLDAKIYSGKLSEIATPSSSFSLGAHIGRTFPTGNLDNFSNPGWLAEVNAEYQFHKNFSAELAGGYYTFDSSFKVIGATAYLKAHATLNSLHLYAGPGLGFYKPDNIKASLGISGKIGVQKAVNNKLWIDLNGAYFNVFTPNQSINFFTAALGFKYFF